MALHSRPEPMNVSPYHPKVKVSLTLSDSLYVAGRFVTGKFEVECRADKGLGIGTIMVELVGIQELTSRDHSATSTFLQARRFFQGPGLPPSNAVLPNAVPGEPPLPTHYHQARRGSTTFFFRIPIPPSSPSSINFGSGLATIMYEVRASVGVAWKGEKRLVMNKKEADLVETYEEDFARVEPEGVVIGENGKIWVQGRVIGGVLIAGESACVELQVKNHSSKKTIGLGITLDRHLHLPNVPVTEKAPLQISDTLATVAFRGPDYIVQPGSEGVANLVFDVPKNARTVKGGFREGRDEEHRTTEALFEVRCVVSIRIGMGLGSKDIHLDLPVDIMHPAAVPESDAESYIAPPLVASPPPPSMSPIFYEERVQSPLMFSPPIMSPHPHVDGQVWYPPPPTHTPHPYQYFAPPSHDQQYYYPPPPLIPPYVAPLRSSSAEPPLSRALPSGLPAVPPQQLLLPVARAVQQPADSEKGKGERASRVTHHLRMYSRHRSVSPHSHRFPFPTTAPAPGDSTDPIPIPIPSASAEPSNSAPRPIAVSTSITTDAQGALCSPRPLLSPKQSYTVDSIANNSLPKSERVEQLERLAHEVEKKTRDLSGGEIPQVIDVQKTLPSPPVPSDKEQFLSPPRPHVETVFSSRSPTSPTHPGSYSRPAMPSSPTSPTRPESNLNSSPPMPPLAAITPVKFLRADFLAAGRGLESGLDALERRLQAEVGTRKMDQCEQRVDARTAVMPIAINASQPSPQNDSAISSLTLAEQREWVGGEARRRVGELELEREFERERDPDSDEHTQKPGGRTSGSGDDVDGDIYGRGRSKGTKRVDGAMGAQLKRKKKKEGTKDEEAMKLRKAAKGRVAEWLGGIQTDIPPLMEETLLSPAGLDLGPGIDSPEVTNPLSSPEYGSRGDTAISNSPSGKERDVTSSPNPRSSGFVPIATLKDRPATRGLSEIRQHARMAAPNDDKSLAGELKALFNPSPVKSPASPKVDRTFSPPAIQPKPARLQGNTKVPQPTSRPKFGDQSVKTDVKPSTRLPTFPSPPMDTEVKYDIRSARGGRGGRVTAAASIWASAMTAEQSNAAKKVVDKSKPLSIPKSVPSPASKPAKPLTKSPLSLATTSAPEYKAPDIRPAKRTGLLKSTTVVPAVISSSHATPMLSSTASLSRPSPLLNPNRSPNKFLPRVTEATKPEFTPSKKAEDKLPASPPRELAFGQARLRDLIKKYQGQTT